VPRVCRELLPLLRSRHRVPIRDRTDLSRFYVRVRPPGRGRYALSATMSHSMAGACQAVAAAPSMGSRWVGLLCRSSPYGTGQVWEAVRHGRPNGHPRADRRRGTLTNMGKAAEVAAGARESESDRALYHIVRGQIEEEADLISQRLSWLIAAQTFLFVGYTILVTSNSGMKLPLDIPSAASDRVALHWILPTVGLLTCATVWIGVVAASVVTRRLKRDYQPYFTRLSAPLNSPEGRPLLPNIVGHDVGNWLGLLAPLILPLALSAVWLKLWIWTP
jgi:hypothetical protein